VPWKLRLFVPALLFVTFAGRFTNDETWDVVTGAWSRPHRYAVPNRGS
jgi:hypothetical protein